MSRGRLIAVVGPSGVGKDSLMAALAARDPQLGIVRRVITRAPGLGGEDYEPATEAAFDAMTAAGAFCLTWGAHDLHYGIPRAVCDRVAGGEVLLVNLSRGVLVRAAEVFPGLVVLNVTAQPETLARRLADRGRETKAGIASRLERAKRALPAGIDAIEIANDGPLEQTATTALASLVPFMPLCPNENT